MTLNSICVLGGSGFVGSHLVPRLAARGLRVRVPTRRRAHARHLLVLPGVEVIEGPIHDPGRLRDLFDGMDAVINLVGILHERRPGDFERAHVALPRAVAAACADRGVRRLLHMSALGASRASRSRYQQTKHAGEALTMAAPALDVTAFRPSVIFGPGDSFLGMFADLLRLAPVIPLANAGARFQPVYVGDVAEAFSRALADRTTLGQSFDLCGPDVYTLEELVRLTATQLGLHRPIVPLGTAASLGFARLMELKPGTPIMTRDNHHAMRVDNVCAPDCAHPFGPPTPLQGVIGYLREAGPRRDYASFRAHAGR